MLGVGGLTRLSAIDYPDKLAAVVFCQGCAWRCSYCHNPELQPFRNEPTLEIRWGEVLDFLKKRQKLLDAVVFSGGEPTLQPALKEAMLEVKALGYLVGLHTAGISPRRLAQVLPLVDWVAMDMKAPWDRHEELTGVQGSGRRARESAGLIRESGVACEFHTIASPQAALSRAAAELI